MRSYRPYTACRPLGIHCCIIRSNYLLFLVTQNRSECRDRKYNHVKRESRKKNEKYGSSLEAPAAQGLSANQNSATSVLTIGKTAGQTPFSLSAIVALPPPLSRGLGDLSYMKLPLYTFTTSPARNLLWTHRVVSRYLYYMTALSPEFRCPKLRPSTDSCGDDTQLAG